MKKGQVSVFIVVVVIIVSIVGVYLLVQNTGLPKKKIDPSVEPIYSFVENCLKEVGEEGIVYIGARGGYYDVPEISMDGEIPYYLYGGKNYMPSKESVEEAIGNYVEASLGECVNDFESFNDFTINDGGRVMNVKIEEDETILTLDYSLSISKGEKTFEFEKFEVEINVRLGLIYDDIESIMGYQMESPRDLDMNLLSYFAKRDNLDIELIEYDEMIVFSIIDNNVITKEDGFVFRFVNQY